MRNLSFILLIMLGSLFSCQNGENTSVEAPTEETTETSVMDDKLAKYVPVKLTTDVSQLGENHKKMIPILIEAAKIMDELFWYEAYGDKAELMNSLTDEKTKTYAEINYGPWDRLAGNESFVEGVGAKPMGANYYP
ncbi:MAG: Zn-dependent hydrolase, partial [Saprospiraceae bacterium]